jgi:molecular chaperone HscB
VVSPSSSDAGGLRDAFAQLGLAPRFDVDPADLERAFFEKSRELHPDRFSSAPVAERVAALARARALNDAYRLLRREGARAEYLLAREGVVIGDNERLDPALVMGLLEEREQLAEARHRADRAAIERMASAMSAAALGAVRAGFGALPAGAVASRGEALAAIKAQLILLRYIERYLEECEAALGEDD